MATVIAIDLSVSMLRNMKIKDTKESFTLLQLATHGVNVLLDYLAVHSRLEFVAVVSIIGQDNINQNYKCHTYGFDEWESINNKKVLVWLLVN